MTCGDCKHFAPNVSPHGKCHCPVPMWSDGALEGPAWVIEHEDASDCPCFERKEEK